MNDKLVDFEANFSVLDRYGQDVTASEFITNPAIGRDQQIKELILILLTPEKSAILIGKPGIGKTAIVEGLAYRMQRGEVPEALQGYTIINIKTASLLGTMPSGESKVQKMIDELKTRDKVILFVDEIHMLIGATDSSSLDFANIFKEGLGRGSIKVIGATTTEEYERYVLRDKAFTRRFQKVEVPEPTREETIQIMMGTLPKFEKQTGRKMKYTSFIKERIMSFLVDITSEYKRVFALGSRYPDVCLTLLKQAFSYTVYDNREYMDIFDIRKAIENSKNIYPDVIKKELPRFDKEFQDIALEERGIKPVEEWRKEHGPTRYEQSINQNPTNSENLSNSSNNASRYSNIFVDHNDENLKKSSDKKDNMFKMLETTPDMLDKKTISDFQPVKTILSEGTLKRFAKIGPAAISKGLKERFRQKNDARNIDEMLLSSDIEVLSNKSNAPSNLPFKYTVTDELKPNGTNSLLLGTPIASTLDDQKDSRLEVETYRSDNTTDNQFNPVGNSLMLDNVPRNQGSFRKESNKNPWERPLAQRERKRESMGKTNFLDDPDQKKGEYLFGAPMYSEENSNNNSSNDSIRNNGEFLFGAPMYSREDSNTASSNGPIQGSDASLFGASMYNQEKPNFVPSHDEVQEKGETLFGAPMYSKKEANTSSSNKNVDIFGQLITGDTMHIENGKLIDSFPSLEQPILQPSVLPNDKPGLIDNTIPSSPESNFSSSNNSSSRKWKFLSDFEGDLEKNKPEPFHELKINQPSTSSREDTLRSEMKNSNRFLSFSDLNQGVISSQEANKSVSFNNSGVQFPSVGIPREEMEAVPNNRTNIDLQLEDHPEKDDYFDDFYDE